MKAPEDLIAPIAEKTDDQLVEMLKQPDDWPYDTLFLARTELRRRGIDTTFISEGSLQMSADQPVFFPVSPLKLVVMSTVTLGIYEIYWFYENWKLVKLWSNSDIKPFLRAIFSVLFCYSCFKEVKEVATYRGVSFPSFSGLLAVVWAWLTLGWIGLMLKWIEPMLSLIGLTLNWRIPNYCWLVCLLAPLALVPIQNVANCLNAIVTPNHNPNTRFSYWNIAGIFIGGILLVMIIVGAFFTPVAAGVSSEAF